MKLFDKRSSRVSRKRAFTLMEVIVALVVVGFVVGALLALLPKGVQVAADVRDRNLAYGMSDAIGVELELMGFARLEALTQGEGEAWLVASQDGSIVKWEEGLTENLFPESDRYFLIVCKRFPDQWMANEDDVRAGRAKSIGEIIPEPLAHKAGNGYLALQVDVQWPYKTFGGDSGSGVAIHNAARRSHFRFPLAVTP